MIDKREARPCRRCGAEVVWKPDNPGHWASMGRLWEFARWSPHHGDIYGEHDEERCEAVRKAAESA